MGCPVLKISYEFRTSIDYSLLAMQVAEYDVVYLSNRYHIKGYTREDIAQELRLKLWEALPQYDPAMGGMRTWARRVMKNRLKDLHNSTKRHKRAVLYYQVPIDETEYAQ